VAPQCMEEVDDDGELGRGVTTRPAARPRGVYSRDEVDHDGAR
jgi:hypothetical protein